MTVGSGPRDSTTMRNVSQIPTNELHRLVGKKVRALGSWYRVPEGTVGKVVEFHTIDSEKVGVLG